MLWKDAFRIVCRKHPSVNLLLDPQDYKLVVRTREMIQVMQVWAPLKVAYSTTKPRKGCFRPFEVVSVTVVIFTLLDSLSNTLRTLLS